jgi:hypothetical protein
VAEEHKAVVAYFEALDKLESLRINKAPESEILAAKEQEQKAWDAVKHLMPDAMCR